MCCLCPGILQSPLTCTTHLGTSGCLLDTLRKTGEQWAMKQLWSFGLYMRTYYPICPGCIIYTCGDYNKPLYKGLYKTTSTTECHQGFFRCLGRTVYVAHADVTFSRYFKCIMCIIFFFWTEARMFNMSMISIAWHWLPFSPTNNPHHLTWMQLTGSGLRRNVGCNQEDASKQISQEMQAGYCTLDSRLVGGCEASCLVLLEPRKDMKSVWTSYGFISFALRFFWDQRINVSPPRRYKTPRVKWCWQATAMSGRGYEGHMGSSDGSHMLPIC